MKDLANISLPNERWADVPGYEGLHLVSDQGRVWTNPRTSKTVRNGVERDYTTQGKIRTLTENPSGYQYVPLKDESGEKANHYVHRLVAEAFVHEGREVTEVVRHRNDIPSDNVHTNLLWGTHGDNVADKVSRDRQQKGVDVPQSILNDEAVSAIRSEYAAGGVTMEKLAEQHGVTRSNVSNVISRKTWKHVP
jgi:hypothetical protein